MYGVPAEQSRRLGVVFLIAGSLLHWLAIVVWLPPVDFLALTTLLFGIALVIGGRRLAQQLQFPILFLFFMFPLPALLTDIAAVFLQGWVAGTAVYLMQAVIPVYQQGYVIYLPGHQLEVGEAGHSNASEIRMGLSGGQAPSGPGREIL